MSGGRRAAWLSLAVALLAGCGAGPVPAPTATPGAAVTVSGDVVDAGDFRVRAPQGWRVITGPASEPPFLLFAAPDGCTVILVSRADVPLPALAGCPSDAPLRVERAEADAGVRVAGTAADGGTALAALVERVAESVAVEDAGA